MFRAFLAHHQEILYCLVSRSLCQTVIQSTVCRYFFWKEVNKKSFTRVFSHDLWFNLC
jgi:hypothetical protein